MLFSRLNKAVPPATKNTPMQAHERKINHLHAGALLDKHWPSTLHWVREWRFTSAWLNLNWNCEENEIKIAIKSEGIKHGERSKWESVKSGRVQQQMTEHEATEHRTGVNWFNSRRQPQQLPYRCSAAGSELSHLQIWPWLRCTGPPSLVWCSDPSHAEVLCVPHSGSCPPGETSRREKVSVMEENLWWTNLWISGSLVPELWHFVTCCHCFSLNQKDATLLRGHTFNLFGFILNFVLICQCSFFSLTILIIFVQPTNTSSKCLYLHVIRYNNELKKYYIS